MDISHKRLIYIPCWPVNVPHSVGGSTFARVAVAPVTRLPDPGVRTRLSPVVQTPVAATGWPIVVVTKSSLMWHMSGLLKNCEGNSIIYSLDIIN